jgi:hypothetical protein
LLHTIYFCYFLAHFFSIHNLNSLFTVCSR